MKKLLFVTLSLCFAQLLNAALVDENVDITVDGETRNYQLYVPNSVKDNCPVVVSLHGANGKSTDRSPFRTSVADKEGCIVVYPQGKTTSFPIGFGGSTTGWTSTGEDNFDAKFLKAVIDDVASKYVIDANRIYCCGFSNGGMMTYAMSNACSDVFAAFASISGYQINEFHFRHTGKRPVPFLHIHGKEDGFVLYSLMPTIVDEMVARLGANPVPVKTVESGKYTKSVYEAGEGSFPYVYYEIDGMGHSDYTENTEDGSSAQTMWNFFKDYTLDSPCDPTLKWRPGNESSDYSLAAHGWTVNNETTLLEFGGDQYTTENKNVYHSLQFESGKYKLCFKSSGETGKTIGVKIEKLTDSKKAVLDATANVGEDAELTFEVSDGWGEYKLTMTRPSSSDAITVTDIVITQTEEGEEPAEAATPLKILGTEYTSVEELEGKIFAIVNKAEGKAICNKRGAENDYEMQYLPYAEAFTTDCFGYLFRIESAEGGYYLRSINPEGSTYQIFGWSDTYFQSHSAEKDDCCFYIFKDADGEGYSIWDIQYDAAESAFTLKNLGTGNYLNDPTKRADSDTPGYFTFCEVKDNVATFSIENPENLVEITQDQGVTLDDFDRTELEEGADYNTYTATADLQVAFKMYDIDVKDCDYVVVNFAEPVAKGWCIAFWAQGGTDNVEIPEGSTEYKYVFAKDSKCAIKDDILPQICMLTLWGAAKPLVAKVKGIYKHLADGAPYSRTYSFSQALDFTGIDGVEAYVITSFNPSTATLKLKRVYQVPANTGLYLIAKEGDHKIPVIESAADITTNLLHASSGSEELNQADGSYTNLIFTGTGASRGFHPLSKAGVIGANKAYLQLPTDEFNSISGARLNLVFDDGTTAITQTNETMMADGAWYTVSGVKLNAKPSRKGIYLNNGKKYVVR